MGAVIWAAQISPCWPGVERANLGAYCLGLLASLPCSDGRGKWAGRVGGKLR